MQFLCPTLKMHLAKTGHSEQSSHSLMNSKSPQTCLKLHCLAATMALILGLHTASAQLTFVSGHYYSANYFSHTITQYNPAGAMVGSFDVPSSLANEIRGLAFGPDGLLYACGVTDLGFKVLTYDASGTLRQTYSGDVYVRGNLSYGKLAVNEQHIYVTGQNKLTRFDIGSTNPGVVIYENNQVFDVDLLPDGNLLVLSAYDLDEITPNGAKVRSYPFDLVDARGVEYDPATGKLFVTMLGYSDFYFRLMRFDRTTGLLEANTSFWYGDDIFLTNSGNLLVGSRTTTPTIFTQNLMQAGSLNGGSQMFVTQLLPEFLPPNQPPALVVPESTFAECGSPLDLTALISDPDGDAMTVVWTLNGTVVQTDQVPAGSPGISVSVPISILCPLGTNTIEIAVSDGSHSVSGTSVITIADTSPPEFTDLASSATVLWPPDHRMVEVNLYATVKDACASATWRIVGVESNQAFDGRGKGRAPIDWSIADDDTVFLRAQRSGSGEARVYYVLVQAIDLFGNQSEIQTVTVTVPRSMMKPR